MATIVDILVRARLIDDLQLRSATAHQSQWGGRIPNIVVEKRFAPEDKVVQAIADALKLPRVDLDQVENDAQACAKLDMAFARDHAVFPCALKDGGKTLWLAMADPTDIPVADEVAQKTRLRLKLVVASERQILAAIKRAYLGESQKRQEPMGFGSFAPLDLDAGSEEEGKLVDMAGHTLVKDISKLVPTASASEPSRLPPPVGAAGDLLDDLMGSGAHATWSPQDLERLGTIQDQQEKGARILRAVLELCVEKGWFRVDEYRAKLKQ